MKGLSCFFPLSLSIFISIVGLSICKYEPLWQEVNEEFLNLRWPPRTVVCASYYFSEIIACRFTRGQWVSPHFWAVWYISPRVKTSFYQYRGIEKKFHLNSVFDNHFSWILHVLHSTKNLNLFYLDVLCQVWLKLAQWFLRRRCFKFIMTSKTYYSSFITIYRLMFSNFFT